MYIFLHIVLHTPSDTRACAVVRAGSPQPLSRCSWLRPGAPPGCDHRPREVFSAGGRGDHHQAARTLLPQNRSGSGAMGRRAHQRLASASSTLERAVSCDDGVMGWGWSARGQTLCFCVVAIDWPINLLANSSRRGLCGMFLFFMLDDVCRGWVVFSSCGGGRENWPSFWMMFVEGGWRFPPAGGEIGKIGRHRGIGVVTRACGLELCTPSEMF